MGNPLPVTAAALGAAGLAFLAPAPAVAAAAEVCTPVWNVGYYLDEPANRWRFPRPTNRGAPPLATS